MIDKNNIPKHIAIIMDGNGRWAKSKGLPRTAGHRAGIDRIKEIVDAARQLGIKVITFFAFSTENWLRPKREVDMLMRALNNFLARQINELNKDNIRFFTIGRDEPVPKYLQTRIKDAENRTKDNTGLVVILALNYGSRQEILDAAKKLAARAIEGEVRIENLSIDEFSRYFYTAGLPDPDLLIRTSGEMRLSNFLLWQSSYAEFYFPKKYWPEFRAKDLEQAIRVYQNRQRRFGGLSAIQKDN